MRRDLRAAITREMLWEARSLIWPVWEGAYRAGRRATLVDGRLADGEDEANALGRRLHMLVRAAEWDGTNVVPYADRLEDSQG